MDFAKMIRPFANRLSNMVSRVVVALTDDSKDLQILQVDSLEGETRDGVEHFQPYGFASNPKPGAEGVVLWVGGRRDHGLAIGVADRRYRIKNLESGEVAVYDSSGSTIVFKANGDIELTPSSGTAIVTGDVEVSGDVLAGAISLTNHTHDGSSISTTATIGAGGTPGVQSGSTGPAQ